MKLTSLITGLAVSGLTLAQQGFNIAAEASQGGCKAQSDWENNFNVMKSLPGNFRYVRVYASSDCNTLANAVPAAIATGIKVLVGVWTEDSSHYAAEKTALQSAIAAHGVGWIYAVSVGSEDLYRGDTNANTLAGQINEVRNLISRIGGKGIPVGHVDTWTAWTNDANAAAIRASDFLGVDSYPYFQSSSIANAKSVFDQSIQATRNSIARFKPGTPLWITETGWPVAGPNYGAAVPSAANAQSFWRHVWCSYPNAVKFAYTLRDYYVAPANPSFGVVGQNFQPLYNLAC